MVKNNYVTGTYRCKDPIKNFKVRVKIQQEKQSVIRYPLRDESSNTSEHRQSEERVLCWQEKVYSPREQDAFRTIKDESSRTESRTRNTMLFTYIDAKPTQQAFTVNKTVRTPVIPGTLVGHTKKKYIPKNIVTLNKSDNHSFYVLLQSFHILAYLRNTESFDENSEAVHKEYELCTIVWNEHSGVLTVFPDFSCYPYILEVDHHGRNTYQYWIEHVSSSITPLQQNVIQNLNKQLVDITKSHVSFEFHKPSPTVLEVYLMVEIKCARYFDSTSLYIRYFIELPSGWSCDNLSDLSGVTQTSMSENNTVMFGHTFEIKLMFNLDILQLNTDVMPSSPQLFLEVLSCDWWGRTRTEGYGFLHLPRNPGYRSLFISAWRPLQLDTVSQMRQYFLGGSPELIHPTYSGIPYNQKSKILSKFGMETVTSGEVEVIINSVHQSEALSDAFNTSSTKSKDLNTEDMIERLSIATLVHSVNTVLVAFHQARKRMIEARKRILL